MPTLAVITDTGLNRCQWRHFHFFRSPGESRFDLLILYRTELLYVRHPFLKRSMIIFFLLIRMTYDRRFQNGGFGTFASLGPCCKSSSENWQNRNRTSHTGLCLKSQNVVLYRVDLHGKIILYRQLTIALLKNTELWLERRKVLASVTYALTSGLILQRMRRGDRRIKRKVYFGNHMDPICVWICGCCHTLLVGLPTSSLHRGSF